MRAVAFVVNPAVQHGGKHGGGGGGRRGPTALLPLQPFRKQVFTASTETAGEHFVALFVLLHSLCVLKICGVTFIFAAHDTICLPLLPVSDGVPLPSLVPFVPMSTSAVSVPAEAVPVDADELASLRARIAELEATNTRWQSVNNALMTRLTASGGGASASAVPAPSASEPAAEPTGEGEAEAEGDDAPPVATAAGASSKGGKHRGKRRRG